MNDPARRTLRARRLSQAFFLVLFFFLLFRTNFRARFTDGSLDPNRLDESVKFFFHLDPLAALSTALSTGTVYKGLWMAALVLAPAFLLGRFFCGWICPLGTLNGLFSPKNLARGPAPARWVKYTLLLGLLAASLLGVLQIGLLDPLSLLFRSLSLAVLPALSELLEIIRASLFDEPTRGFPGYVAETVLRTSSLAIYGGAGRAGFRMAPFLFSLLAVVLLINIYRPFFWCRVICPLGALLGLASRTSLLRLEKDPEGCTACGKCAEVCRSSADPHEENAPPEEKTWRAAECHLCWSCVKTCPEASLRFRLFSRETGKNAPPDLSRRRVAAALVAGVVLPPLLRSLPPRVLHNAPKLIRPPGALEETEFLRRCIKCGQCMKVCPTSALQPALWEGGPEGFLTPVLVPRIGYCEPSCVLCSKVCPTGAIRPVSLDEKVGRGVPAVRIGTAFIDRGRCLPWAMGVQCVVCEEWCPTSPKSILFRKETVLAPNGREKNIGRPLVRPDICTGCGVCEHVCPVRDRPAIYVTSAGESRSRRNSLLLGKSG